MKPLSIGHDAVVGRDDVVGVRVPAEPAVGLEQGDVVGALQQVGGGQSGDAGPDDGGGRPLQRGGGHLPAQRRERALSAA